MRKLSNVKGTPLDHGFPYTTFDYNSANLRGRDTGWGLSE